MEFTNIFDNEVYFFDFDGVIIDSVNIKGDCFGKIYRRYGKQIVKKVIAFHLQQGGMNRKEKFKYYHEKILGKKISENELEQLSKRFSKMVFDKMLKAKMIDGALDFLNLLKKKKKIGFIVSAAPQHEIREIVNKKELDRLFLEVLGYPKSKEDILIYLIKKYGIDVKKAAYFGDAASDFEAAKKTGIKFIGINYFDSPECYRDFRELLNANKNS